LRQTIITQAMSDLEVNEVMTKTVSVIPSGKTVQEAQTEFFDVAKHGGFPVVDSDRVVGMVTRTDLMKVQKEEKNTWRIEEIMTPRSKLVTARPKESVADVFMKLSKYNVGRLLVFEGESLVGIVTRSDVIRAVQVKVRVPESV